MPSIINTDHTHKHGHLVWEQYHVPLQKIIIFIPTRTLGKDQKHHLNISIASKDTQTNPFLLHGDEY